MAGVFSIRLRMSFEAQGSTIQWPKYRYNLDTSYVGDTYYIYTDGRDRLLCYRYKLYVLSSACSRL